MTPENTGIPSEGGAAAPGRDRVRHEFLSAREISADAEWAESALVSLVLADVQIDVAEDYLVDAAALVQESQEGPAELYGAPRDWATEQAQSLRRTGLSVFDDPLRMDLRGNVVTVLGLASGLSTMFVLSDLLSLLFRAGPDRGLTPGLALAPLLLAAVLITLIQVFRWSVRRFPFALTVAVCVLVLAACAGTTAAVIMPLGQVSPEVGRWWTLLLIPCYGMLAWAVARLWRASTPAPQPLTVPEVLAATTVEDEEWLCRARGALRQRGDLSEKRISAALTEAQGHAADQGTRLVEEFASPEEYGRSLPGDPRVKPARLALFYGALSLGWLALALFGGIDSRWQLLLFTVLVLLCLWQSWGHARAVRAAARGARS